MADAIAVYGASGSLGHLVCQELIRRGASLRLGGRDSHKLERSAAQLGPHTTWQAAPLDDAVALREFLTGCRVLVNTLPSFLGAERLVAAAIDAGVHYIDAGGEQAKIRDVFERHGTPAERRGVALVPAFGFDYALGDCLARIVAREHQPAREVVVAYAIEGADVVSNSLQFAAETPGGGEVFFESGAWTPARLDVYRRTIEFPPPFGRQAMARYGAGEIVTVPRHTQTEAVTSLITARSLVPHPLLVPLFPYLRPAVALIRRTPARHLLAAAFRLRPARSASPTAVPRAPRFAIVATVHALDGSRRRGVVEGGDFHRVTVAALALGACVMASPAFSQRGALPPALAVDPEVLLDELRPLGVTWQVERSDTTPRTR